ncbi:cytochrome [Mycolicibacterium iranicum]|uniref:Steroid C26-monooxygenase n=2 Tax=Mycolicibacterium iranicum TaxID=912594 RepID=A0A178LQE8_MYCIR|nr:cytochrome [Mycolicibacterium iranicum]
MPNTTSDAIAVGGVDLTDPDTYLAGMPYDAFRELRYRAPVAWHPCADSPGFWALTRHDDIYDVSRDSETWSSQTTGVFIDVPAPDEAYQLALMMLTMDPPRHTALRALVSRGFTPRHVARLSERTADMARDIVDTAMERGECEFVGDVAGALPSYVIAELLGIPLDDGRALYALTEIMNTRALGDPELIHAQLQLFEYATTLAAGKRANPGDDIATALLHAEVDGKRLTELEFNLFFMLLLNAGGDTTRNLVAAGTLALIEHPDQWARLAADPSLMPTAIEEMLRWTSPVTVFTRTATRDTRLRGIAIREGERVAMFYPSANRDEDHFTEPDRFDVGRTPNQHLAFGGGGAHFCLGASLARVEAAAIFREMLGRTQEIELAGPVERVRSVLMNGIHSMPVRFTPAAVPA